ncbi:MAG TPA: caspase family protein [Candidatus Competibacteraceae bacterium]|nr:MAG: DUF4384 domain-containing protein [Candidatus Competibacteraceae bacterium]HQA25086.1 caspase family protein [Candidatus Competibacteraceae bacterium]
MKKLLNSRSCTVVNKLLALFILVSLIPVISASAADVYSLVIGVDDYKNIIALDGAVNDAKDVANALSAIGAKQVVLLENDKADRDSIFKQWKSLTSQAKEGDLLVFAYAGHGSQEPEHVANSEVDHLDENFLLEKFKDRDKESYQRIVDDEIDALFRETPHLNILFIADSCHSGTVTRSFAAPKKFKARSVPPLNIQNDALSVLYGSKLRGEKKTSASITNTAKGVDGEVAVNVFGFSGVPDDEEVIEITDPDTKQSRGALSMAFAKALRNAAAHNEKEISRGQLEHFVTENVRMLTDGQQKAQAFGGQNFTIPVHARSASTQIEGVKPPSADSDKTTTATSSTAQLVNFTVFVTNIPSSVSEAQWRPLLGQAKTTDDNQTADAIWDIGREKIFSQLGDVVYDGHQTTRAFSRANNPPLAPSNGPVEIAYATPVFDKLMVVERIKKLSEAVSPTIALKPNDRLHHAGEQVTLEISGQQYPYFTLFNIASDGTINNLYPLKEGDINDSLEIQLDKPYTLPLNVEPPYGNDHFVVIFSEKALVDLHKELQGMNGRQNANQIEAALNRHLQGVKYQIGIHSVFTGS